MLRARYPVRTLWLGLAVLLASAVTWGAGATEAGQGGTFRPEKIFPDLPLDRPYAFQPYRDGFLVLDRGNHRLLELDPSGRILRQIGQLGQADHELRHANDFAVDSSGRFVIITGTTPFAIKIFGAEGAFENVIYQGLTRDELAFYKSRNVAVNPKGEILLSQPRQEHLVTRYSRGGKALGGFGEHFSATDAFPRECTEQPLCRDRRFAVSLNRVLFAVGGDGSVVVASLVAPLVRKYSPKGDLLFETRLEGGILAELAEQRWLSPEGWDAYSFNSDGIQVLQTLSALTIDPSDGRIYCLVGAKEIFVLSPSGKQTAILRQEGDKAIALEALAVNAGIAYLSNWGHVYRARLR